MEESEINHTSMIMNELVIFKKAFSLNGCFNVVTKTLWNHEYSIKHQFNSTRIVNILIFLQVSLSWIISIFFTNVSFWDIPHGVLIYII